MKDERTEIEFGDRAALALGSAGGVGGEDTADPLRGRQKHGRFMISAWMTHRRVDGYGLASARRERLRGGPRVLRGIRTACDKTAMRICR
jgi:hypothetical protein